MTSSIKLPISLIVKDDTFLEQLNDVVIRVNKIVIHTYNFLKLYIIDCYKKKKQTPNIDIKFIMNIMMTVSSRNTHKGREKNDETKIIMNELNDFYTTHYEPLIYPDELTDENELSLKNKLLNDNLTRILNYEAITILTNITNNIKEHYVSHVYKLLNIAFKTKERKDDKNYIKFIRLIIKDILEIDCKYESKDKETVDDFKKIFIPNKEIFLKDSIHYDIQANPLDYLYNMFEVQKILEKLKKKQIEENENNKNKKYKSIKTINVLPLRTNIIPKNITIDTTVLLDLFYEDQNIPKNKIRNNISRYKNKIWYSLFKMEKRKIFNRKDKVFSYIIKTDGISVSLMFDDKKTAVKKQIRQDKMKEGRKKIKNNENQEENIIKLDENQEEKINENQIVKQETKKINKKTSKKKQIKYIDKITKKERQQLINKKIITIDPGHDNIIYSMSNINNSKYRYTQAQKNVQTKKNKYNKIRETLKKGEKYGEDNVCNIESTITISSKTISFNEFKQYIKEKNKVNEKLYKFYEKKLFRKFKLNAYTNTLKSEDKMLKEFNKKHDITEENKKDTCIILGDYSRTECLKWKEPSITKKIRRIFDEKDYNIYLIDEYRTSKLCNICESPCKNKIIHTEENEPKKVWRILRCSNKNCKIYHNRDINSCMNMHKIVRSYIMNNKRPKNYLRTKEPDNL